MPANTAAWLRKKNGRLEVGPAPYTPPGEHEIVVRNHAVAINPVDWMMEVIGGLICPWLTYPSVLGSDVAGEVAEVGRSVTRFQAGDRVLGHAVGTEKNRNSAGEGAFQAYTVLLDRMTAPIPADISYERAAVLPLGLSTAACGLFQQDFLALRLPACGTEPTGETVLVWGGSTSVGSNAIQLAVAAGYEVITTASPCNFEYVKGLGASQVFDYRSGTVVADVIAALQGGEEGHGDRVHVGVVRADRGQASTACPPRPAPRPARVGADGAAAEGAQMGSQNQAHLGQRAQGQRGRPGDLRRLPPQGAG
jgi:NADPH:quinone reductase-like Zn-dependent oxidoreductase